MARLILVARRGAHLTQRELAERAKTSQAALSAYERGLKTPSLVVAERIVEAAGYRLDLVTSVNFTRYRAPRVGPFWVPDRLWRGRLPECFAKVHLRDGAESRTRRFDLGRRSQRRWMYELLLRKGAPGELIDWIDGALLVDLWGELRIPPAIRAAWQPAVTAAADGPLERPWYGRTERDVGLEPDFGEAASPPWLARVHPESGERRPPHRPAR